ncbi:hypothetical protein T4B_1713 [Trichinella pseudospiralis]|uniref:Uncharacterized protein n=2 Tax=Trichinella pseudospiralis TaxID=6337 RepID=A0A0V1G4S5_TRIPS|nr:hypothetical protein T4D_4763 [Trichinella pseudospiralis]KRZ12531.1 hypothetical protein T4B_1713 [Trichinella pseudospiralis]
MREYFQKLVSSDRLEMCNYWKCSRKTHIDVGNSGQRGEFRNLHFWINMLKLASFACQFGNPKGSDHFGRSIWQQTN